MEAEVEDLSWLSGLPGPMELESLENLASTLLVDAKTLSEAYLAEGGETSVISSTSSSPRQDISDPYQLRDDLTYEAREGNQMPKLQRSMRPKDEIEVLQRSILDLQYVVQLLHQRRQASLRTPPAVEDSMSSNSLWRDVASRQYFRLRASHSENRQLRSQVQAHIDIIQGLMRIIHRAEEANPMEGTSTGLVDASMFRMKRDELQEITSQMQKQSVLDHVCSDERFVSTHQEVSDTMFYRQYGDSIPSGTALASGWIRRHVPESVAKLSDSLWARKIDFGVPEDTMQLELIEQSTKHQILQYRIRFKGARGPIILYGAGVLLRHQSSLSNALIGASSIWPNPANESPWNSVGIDIKQWLLLLPQDAPITNPRSEVLVNTQVSKLARPFSASEGGEATVLQDFVAKTVRFMMERLHRDIDNVLLNQAVALMA